MGNTIFIQGKRVCIKPLCSRLEAIQKLEPPVTVKGCRSFAGMVNFLSIFCQDLQKLLKPIYDVTRKGRPFKWQQEQQTAFEEIKSRLQNHQSYIYQMIKEGFICIQTQVNMLQEVHYTKYKMVNPN